MPIDEPIDWLLDEILTGMQYLLSLSLPDHPPMETIDMTAVAWCRALERTTTKWDEELDAERVAAGFQNLLPTLDRWPSPAQLIAVIPPRPAPLALPPARQTDEHREIARQWLPKIREQLKELDEKFKQRSLGGGAHNLTILLNEEGI